MTKDNLGSAHAEIGHIEGSTERLEEAVTAHEQALLERTRERVPLDWAATTLNIAIAELSLYDRSSEPSQLDRALELASTAREVFAAAGATSYLENVDTLIANINRRISAGP